MAGWLTMCLVGARDDIGGLEVGGLKGTAGNGDKELATTLRICNNDDQKIGNFNDATIR